MILKIPQRKISKQNNFQEQKNKASFSPWIKSKRKTELNLKIKLTERKKTEATTKKNIKQINSTKIKKTEQNQIV